MTPLRFIALRLTPYSDSRSILTAFSREQGRVALSVTAGSGKRAGRIRALTLPLSVVEGIVSPRSGRDILTVGQLTAVCHFPSLHADPVKQMMAMFLAEVLSVTLASSGPDEAVFDFIVMATAELDKADGSSTANFHLCFLYQLARLLGIEPDTSTYAPGRLLDLREGIFRSTPPLTHSDYLSPEASQAAFSLSKMKFGNLHCWRLNRRQRSDFIDVILRYYGIHYASLRSLRSLDVLRKLLD